MKSPFHVMIIPTLGCPSKCHYCWSSDESSPKMSIETVREIAAWLKDYRSDQVTITFHGGEPLLAGADFYREALPILSEELAHLEPTFALQSNLWLLTPELAKILAEYRIPIGSSIDGPEEITEIYTGIDSLKLTYLDSEDDQWKDAWEEPERLPLAVKVELKLVRRLSIE